MWDVGCPMWGVGRGFASHVRHPTSGIAGVVARQREVEGRAGARAALGPGAAAVALHDAADVGEADPGALELLVAVQALEDAEELVGVLHVEADAVVPDAVDDLAVQRFAGDADA